jgi:hypothetical protein
MKENEFIVKWQSQVRKGMLDCPDWSWDFNFSIFRVNRVTQVVKE